MNFKQILGTILSIIFIIGFSWVLIELVGVIIFFSSIVITAGIVGMVALIEWLLAG